MAVIAAGPSEMVGVFVSHKDQAGRAQKIVDSRLSSRIEILHTQFLRMSRCGPCFDHNRRRARHVEAIGHHASQLRPETRSGGQQIAGRAAEADEFECDLVRFLPAPCGHKLTRASYVQPCRPARPRRTVDKQIPHRRADED
ncbi:hypothetical protein [Novosphingobium aquae]|uniref:Uncharacterized protein n=1 Tax=Novosphingobium aquae TaxID=3133435 RepID=A0ABU8S5U9_9SPHN